MSQCLAELIVRQAPSNSESAQATVQSLSRGLKILAQFTAETQRLSLAELSRRTGLHKATVHRFVKALDAEGYLLYDSATGAYGIGPAWAVALYALGSDTVLAQILDENLQELARSSRETAALGVRRGDDVQVVHVLPPERSFVPVLPSDRLHPLHSTWNVHCQIFLAHSNEDTKRRMLAVPQPRYTEHTLVDPPGLRARLQRILEEDVAYEREEFHLGTCAVGVPVRCGERVVAAVALIVPVERFTDKTVPFFIEQLRSAAAGMGERLCLALRREVSVSRGH